MKFSTTDRVIQRVGSYVYYINFIVEKIRKFFSLPCEAGSGRLSLIDYFMTFILYLILLSLLPSTLTAQKILKRKLHITGRHLFIIIMLCTKYANNKTVSISILHLQAK